MQCHTLPVPVAAGYKSQGYFALKVPSRLVIFVHGFMGSATDTWNDFQDFILNTNRFEEADIIFYGYKSLQMQANNQALMLLDVVKRMQTPGASGLLPDGLPERSYEKIILVAHSLGSIITRRMLLSANQLMEPWVDKTRMVLFAPAHNGARAANLAMAAAGPILGMAAFVARYQYPVLDELAVDSPTINRLREDTMTALQGNGGGFTKACVVVWAEKERVADNQPYCSDPVPKLVLEKGHIEVCKPIAHEFESPVDYVLAAF